MPDSGIGTDTQQTGPSICIIACKDLSRNMRTIQQAKALARAGSAVTVIGYQVPDARLAGDQAVATLVATGAPPYPGPLMLKLWLMRRLRRGDAAMQRVAAAGVAVGRSRGGRFARLAMRHLAGRSFDVVQAHFDRALIAAAALASRCGARLVFDAVEVPFDDELLPTDAAARAVRLAEIRQETEIACRADGWITVNDSLADTAVERFHIARPLVVRNCQDAGYRPSDGRLRRDLGLTDRARILLHLNTMRRGEGLETAIDALAHLPEEFHLVGLGPMPERGFLKTIRRRAVQRGVAQRFHIAPMQPPHAVRAYIAGADIAVISREGARQNMRLSLPNRLFQAIAARLPVVATPLPEIGLILRDWQVGLPFDELDVIGLASAIRGISEPETLARFRAAEDNAARALTWEQESVPYVRFMQSLARGVPFEAESRQTPLQRIAG